MTIISQLCTNMQTLFCDIADNAAEQANLVQRRGKVTGKNLCQTLVVGWWQNPDATLEELTQVGRSVGLCLTPQGLENRWDARTARFLQLVLEQLVSHKVANYQIPFASMDAFTQVYVDDSSVVALPEAIVGIWQGLGGKGPVSSVKLQTRLDLKTGELDGPHLVHGKTNDRLAASMHHAPPAAGSLLLRDLGYWKIAEWQAALDGHYYLLSRFKASTQFWLNGQCWTAARWCNGMTDSQFDQPILLGVKDKIPARLLGVRVSPAVAQERRRKLKRKQKERGQTLTDESLALCDWTILITNLSPEQLTLRQGLIWLGVRWQIELLFKLWKSVGKIDKSRSANPWRILCEFYAKLIAMVLQQWLFVPTIWHFPDRSWTKAARTIQTHVMRLVATRFQHHLLVSVCQDIQHVLAKGCRINRSKTDKRTYQKLLELGTTYA